MAVFKKDFPSKEKAQEWGRAKTNAGWEMVSMTGSNEGCKLYHPDNCERTYATVNKKNPACWVKKGCLKKKSGGVTKPPVSGGSYKDCTGQTRKRGCKDTDGAITEVQACIGVKADGKFGPKTETALKSKTGKITFEENEVEAICTGKPTSGTSGGNTETPEGKKNYWKNLITKEQIWGKGYIHTTKGGDVVYVVKTAKDDINTKFSLDSLSNADLSKFDYWVHYVIPQGEDRGQLGKLVKYMTTNAEEKVKIETNPRWKWQPNEEIESVDLLEVLNRMLKKKIQEQKYYGVGKDEENLDQGVRTDGGRYYGLGKDDENQGTTGVVSPSKVEGIPNQSQTSSTSTSQGTTQPSSTTPSTTSSATNPNLTKEDLIRMFGFVGDDGKLIDPKFAIESLGKQITGIAGKGNLQGVIQNSGARSYYFAEYNELVGMVGLGDEYKLKIPSTSTVSVGEIITTKNESLLIPYEDATTKNEFIKETFGNYLGTNSTLPIYVSKRQIADVATSQTKCPFDVAGAKKYLINYIMNGITADMITSPKMTEKQTLCACYKSGAFADFVQGKATITSADLGSIPERDKPISMVDKQLKWKEIEDFIRGEKVNGKTINPYFTDRDFGKMSCISPIRESFNRSVKRNISEAIYNKKNVVNGVKNKVLRRINM